MTCENEGMSMRDFFAAKALGGLLASPRPPVTTRIGGGITADDYAQLAYVLADAMLAERSKTKK